MLLLPAKASGLPYATTKYHHMITTVKVVPCLLREHNTSTQLLAFLNPPPLEDFQLPVGPAESTGNLETAALSHLLAVTGIGKAKIIAPIGTLEVIRPADPATESPKERQFWKIFHANSSQTLSETWSYLPDENQPDSMLRYFWQDLLHEGSHIRPPFQSVLKLVRSYLIVQSVRKNYIRTEGQV